MDSEPTPFLKLFRQVGLVRVSKITPDDTKPGNFLVCMQTRDTWKSPLVRTTRFANTPGFPWYAPISTHAIMSCVELTLLLSLIMAGSVL